MEALVAISLAGYFEGASERRGHQRLAIVCRFFLFFFFSFLEKESKSEKWKFSVHIVYCISLSYAVLEKAGGRKYSKRYVLLSFRNKGWQRILGKWNNDDDEEQVMTGGTGLSCAHPDSIIWRHPTKSPHKPHRLCNAPPCSGLAVCDDYQEVTLHGTRSLRTHPAVAYFICCAWSWWCGQRQGWWSWRWWSQLLNNDKVWWLRQ